MTIGRILQDLSQKIDDAADKVRKVKSEPLPLYEIKYEVMHEPKQGKVTLTDTTSGVSVFFAIRDDASPNDFACALGDALAKYAACQSIRIL